MTSAEGVRPNEVVYGLTRGLLLGVLAAAIEAFFLTVASRANVGAEHYVAHTATTFLVVTAFYAVVGGAWGLVAGLAARGSRRWIPPEQRAPRIDLFVTLAVPLGFAVNSTFEGWPSGLRWTLPCGLAVVASVLVFSEIVSRRMRALFSKWLGPWALATVFFGVGWLLSGPLAGRDETTFALGTLGFVALVLALARLARWRFPYLRPLGAKPVLVAGLLALVLSGVLRERVVDHGANAAESRRIHRAGPGQPNVLLVTLDTTRADHMPDWGYARNTTPNLSEFGKQALRFEYAISAADLTLPSHASLFTGLYPPAHGASPGPRAPRGKPLDGAFATLAEILAANGFATLAVVANHGFLGSSYALDQGFDVYDERAPVPLFTTPPPYTLRKRVVDFLKDVLPESSFDLTYRKANVIADELIERIDAVHARGERWFCFANFMDAHAPYDPPEPYRSLFAGRVDGFTYLEFQQLSDRVNAGKEQLEPTLRDHMISQYDGGIAYVDAELGRVFAHLKEIGEWDRTIVVITSDHGEAFGEHGTMAHGVSAYDEQVRVPLWFKLPAQKSGRVVRSRVSLVDVAPSILEALALDVPRGLHGRSFLRQVPDPRRVVFAENEPTSHIRSLHPRFVGAERAAYYGAKKLLLTADGRFEIYDTLLDEDELAPSDDRSVPAAVRMVTELDRYIRRVGFGRLLPEPEALSGGFLPPPPGYSR